MRVLNFIQYDERGFAVPESVSLAQYQDKFPLPLKIKSVSWEDQTSGPHSFEAKNLSIKVLPDRSGLICIERPEVKNGHYIGHHGAFILNADSNIRYRLAVPIQLIPGSKDTSFDDARFFLWVEFPQTTDQHCELVGVVTGLGEFRFQLNYVSGEFLAVYKTEI